MENYTKNVWLKKNTHSLLMEARAKFITEKLTDKCTDDAVINEALGVYLYDKSRKD